MDVLGTARRLRHRLVRPVHHLRTGAWTARQLRGLKHALPDQGGMARVARPPRRAHRQCERSMLLVARIGRATCLERSLLRQAWLAEHGLPRDVVIGVRGGAGRAEFAAHAWIDGDADAGVYTELSRIAPTALTVAQR